MIDVDVASRFREVTSLVTRLLALVMIAKLSTLTA